MSNSISFQGNLVADPESRQGQDGKPFTTFKIAENYGKEKDQVNYFSCSANGKYGELILNSCKKGHKLTILSGQMKASIYTNQQGQSSVQLNVSVGSFAFCESASQTQQQQPQQQYQQPPQQYQQAQQGYGAPQQSPGGYQQQPSQQGYQQQQPQQQYQQPPQQYQQAQQGYQQTPQQQRPQQAQQPAPWGSPQPQQGQLQQYAPGMNPNTDTPF